jgi:hypothetical protein
MQHHFNASAIDVANLGTIENDSRPMAIKEWLQVRQETADSLRVKVLWHLHDDYWPTGQHFPTSFSFD